MNYVGFHPPTTSINNVGTWFGAPLSTQPLISNAAFVDQEPRWDLAPLFLSGCTPSDEARNAAVQEASAHPVRLAGKSKVTKLPR